MAESCEAMRNEKPGFPRSRVPAPGAEGGFLPGEGDGATGQLGEPME